MSGPEKTGRAASVRFILITLVIDALGFGLVVPIVPALVVKLSGLPVSGASVWVGWLLAAFAIMQFSCAPILGGLSDRFGRRPVLLLSLSGICANYLLLAWAPSLIWLFLGRLIAGGTAANAATATAYIADVTPPSKRAGQFGLVGASFGIGFVVGPALGGVLGAYDLRLPFYVAAVLAGCNVLYGLFGSAREPAAGTPASVRLAARQSAGLAAGGDGKPRTRPPGDRLGLHLVRDGRPAKHVRVGQSGSRSVGTRSRTAWRWGLPGLDRRWCRVCWSRRIVPALGERQAALIGGSMTAVAYLCIGLAPVGWVVLLGIVIQSMGAITNPAVQGMVSASAGPDRQGETQGALSSVQGLTAIVSPLVASWVFSTFTGSAAPVLLPGAPFIVSALAYCVAIWAIAGLRPALVRDEAPSAVALVNMDEAPLRLHKGGRLSLPYVTGY